MNKGVLTAPALEALLQAPSLAILAVDERGCVILWGPSASRMFGWTESEALGNFLPIVPEEHRQEVHDRIQRELKGELSSALDVRRLRKDGSLVDVSLWTAPLRDRQREVIGILGLYADVTARKKAEEALRESEERYRLLVEAIPQPVWRSNAQGERMECNGRWYEYTGQTAEETRGYGWMKALHPDDVDRVMEKVRDAVAGGDVYQAEYRLRRASDGSYRWHLARALPMKGKDGRVVCWFGSAIDIDDQKGAEEALRRANDELDRRVQERTVELLRANTALLQEGAERKQVEKALRKSEAQYRTLVEQIPAITYIAALDETNTTLYVSPQVERLLGVTLADYNINPHSIWRQHLHPDDRDRVMAELQSVHTSHEPFDCEYRMLNRDGRIVWFRDRAVVVRDEADQPLFLQGVMLDITERKELEQAIVEASNREQTRIGQDLHDSLCQRLAGIAFMWKTVADRVAARLLPEAAEVAEIGRLITMTIDEAHGLARGLCPVELENGDLGLALKDLGSSVEHLFRISCTVRCQRPVRLADKAVALHLYRIAQEAVSNSIRHGKAAHVWIDLFLKNNKQTLTITDDGVGFPGEQLCGRGTGIRRMRYRAQMIGGALTIERESGGGTKVTCVCLLPHGKR